MKKQLARISLGLLLGVCLSVVGQAQPKKEEDFERFPMVAIFRLLRVSDAEFQKLKGNTTTGDIAGEELLSTEILTERGRPCLVHLGRKWPLTYYDPRAKQYQIQYVDTGAKLDVSLNTQDDNKTVNVEMRNEASRTVSTTDPNQEQELTVYPRAFPYINEINYPNLKYGDNLIVSKLSGPTALSYLKTLGLAGAANNNLVGVFRVEHP